MASTSSRYLITIKWASTIILISIITTGAIVTLILRHRWRWRRSNSETTHDSLLLCDTTNTGVHLTQIITESVKASIHDGLKCRSTRRRWRSGGGWSGGSKRSRHLCSGPPRSELCFTPSNGSCIYDTHNRKIRRLRIREKSGEEAMYLKEKWAYHGLPYPYRHL